MKHFIYILILFPLLSLGQCISGDCVLGEGEYKFKNGKYIGQFKGGQPHGSGVFKNKKGYSYDGEWVDGIKNGYGIETHKKGYFEYKGQFENNQRNGNGKITYRNTREQRDHSYDGEWVDDVSCGQGVKIFSQSNYNKIVLKGEFINGLFQGRVTPLYSDELSWEPFNLSRDHFQMDDPELVKLKKLKNPATLDGDIIISCECKNNTLFIKANAMIRKKTSWWASNLPIKTSANILNARQAEFDIVEWYARLFQSQINKEKLPCVASSITPLNKALSVIKKEMRRTIKEYTSETAWNPFKGGLKNPKPQSQWNNKILKKLAKYNKVNVKIDKKINKKIKKGNSENLCFLDVDRNNIPIFPEPKTKKAQLEKVDNKENKIKRSLLPTFPRSDQLE